MKKQAKVVLIIVIVVVVLGGAGSWYFFSYIPKQEAKEKARQELLAKQEAEKKKKEEEAQRKAKYDELIKNADTEFQQENWGIAQSLYSEASSILSNEQYPKDQLVLVNAKLDEIAALEAKKQAGIIETISSPTGRFYIIVSSSVDDDLAMDYASKLAKEGNDVKIIEPHASNKLFSRVSVADYGTWDEALNASLSFTSFKESVWVLKF